MVAGLRWELVSKISTSTLPALGELRRRRGWMRLISSTQSGSSSGSGGGAVVVPLPPVPAGAGAPVPGVSTELVLLEHRVFGWSRYVAVPPPSDSRFSLVKIS